MSPLALSCVIFLLVLGGIFIGTAFRRALPENHLSKETQDVVRLGASLIATIAALVLGLLIGGAKASCDSRSSQVKQLTANVILLDNLLAQYGPEATPLRKGLRGAINPIVERLWHEKITTEPFTTSSEGEKLYLAILTLSPQNETQRSLQARAVAARPARPPCGDAGRALRGHRPLPRRSRLADAPRRAPRPRIPQLVKPQRQAFQHLQV